MGIKVSACIVMIAFTFAMIYNTRCRQNYRPKHEKPDHQKVSCEVGRFGKYPDCTGKCHCVESKGAQPCDSETGACNIKCKDDWFGPFCQHMYTDWHPGYDISEVLTYEPPHPFSWMRLIYRYEVPWGNFQVRFRHSINDSFNNWRIIRYLKADYRSVDIVLPDAKPMFQIQFRGNPMDEVETIRISRGRNVAMGEMATTLNGYKVPLSAKLSTWRPAAAVDGTYRPDLNFMNELLCFKSNAEKWVVIFSTMVKVLSVNINNGLDADVGELAGFTLRFVGPDGEVEYEHVDNETEPLDDYVITLPKAIQAKSLEISKPNGTDVFAFCEVEVFGERICPGHFGLNCENTCNCEFDNDCFIVTGGCPSGCKDGYKGRDCMELKRCTEPLWFGEDGCTYRCHCDNDEDCEKETGVCYNGCDIDWFGPACQYVRSDRQFPFANDQVEPDAIHIKSDTQLSWLRIDLLQISDVSRALYIKRFVHEDWTRIPHRINVAGNIDIDLMSYNTTEFSLRGYPMREIDQVFYTIGRNVALMKRAWHSADTQWLPEYAVDGLVGYFYIDTRRIWSCSKSTRGSWSVELDGIFRITGIKIQSTFQRVGDLRGFKLTLYYQGTVTFEYTDKTNAAGINTIFNVSLPEVKLADTVMISKNPQAQAQELILCEVEVFGETYCPDGTFGLECDQKCNCASNTCMVSTGGCLSTRD